MKKRILVSVSAMLVICVLLGLLQAVVMPKYTDNKEGALVGEYYGEIGDHDVVFVGDCEVYESFVPAILWEKYGISSYVRGSAQQLVWQSYYLLEETLKYETPKAVVFNVMAIKYGEPQREAYNRMTLDGMRWSSSKVGAINASMTEDESFVEYIFPLLACVFLMLTGYYRAVSDTGMDSGRGRVFFNQAAVYCCCLSLIGENRLFYMGMILWLVLDLCPEEQIKIPTAPSAEEE